MNAISIQNTTVLKGIAIIMVVISHVLPIYGVSFVNILGAVGVAIFLFLSGYGLERSYEKNGLKKYFSKKLVKVYIPYVIAVFLFIIWSACIGLHTPASNIIKYCVLMELPQGSYWYLIILFFYYIVFYFACKIENKYTQFAVLLFSSLVLIVLKDFNRGYLWQFASFPGGVFCARLPNSHSRKDMKKWPAMVLILITLISMLMKKMPMVEQHELGVLDTILQILIVYSICALLIYYHKLLNLKIFLIIGEISYSIYLAHCIPLDWLKYDADSKLYIFVSVLIVSTIILIGYDRTLKRIGK